MKEPNIRTGQEARQPAEFQSYTGSPVAGLLGRQQEIYEQIQLARRQVDNDGHIQGRIGFLESEYELCLNAIVLAARRELKHREDLSGELFQVWALAEGWNPLHARMVADKLAAVERTLEESPDTILVAYPSGGRGHVSAGLVIRPEVEIYACVRGNDRSGFAPKISYQTAAGKNENLELPDMDAIALSAEGLQALRRHPRYRSGGVQSLVLVGEETAAELIWTIAADQTETAKPRFMELCLGLTALGCHWVEDIVGEEKFSAWRQQVVTVLEEKFMEVFVSGSISQKENTQLKIYVDALKLKTEEIIELARGVVEAATSKQDARFHEDSPAHRDILSVYLFHYLGIDAEI